MCADDICILRCFCRNKGEKEISFVTSLQDLDFVEVSKNLAFALLATVDALLHECMVLYDLLD